jgi:hypothetical protein
MVWKKIVVVCLLFMICLSCKRDLKEWEIEGVYICYDCNNSTPALFSNYQDTIILVDGVFMSRYFGISTYKIVQDVDNRQAIQYVYDQSNNLISLNLPIYKRGKMTFISILGDDIRYEKNDTLNFSKQELKSFIKQWE